MNIFQFLVILISSFPILSIANVVEPATKHVFKTVVTDDADNLALAGVGVRAKKIAGPIKVNVYSAALYVDKSKALNSLRIFKQATWESLKTSSEFSEIIATAPFKKSIVLRMARDVASQTMIDALAESVKPRIGADKSSLKEFQAILSKGLQGVGAKKDTEFKFRSVSNKLTVAINGVVQGVVSSPALCKALVNVYVDKNAVSTPLIESICKKFADWLS